MREWRSLLGPALLAAAIWLAPVPGGDAAAQYAGAGGTKPPLCGLVAMGPLRFLIAGGPPDNSLREVAAHPQIYAGAVLNVPWSELEPSPGAFDFAAIDRGLARVQAYNEGNRGPRLRAKLRVLAGRTAPDWVKAESGGTVEVQGPRFTIDVPRFWTAPYHRAWQDLQRALAARYDADPRLGEVAVTSCSTLSGEPFVLPALPDGIAALHRAGFSDAAYRACLSGATEDYTPWQRTALDYTVAPFRDMDSGRPVVDTDVTIAIMRQWRAQLGGRGVLATHGLNDFIRPAVAPIYEELRRLGPPIAFQTISPRVDFNQAIRLGLTYRPTEIELWDSVAAGGVARENAGEMLDWARGLSCRVGG